MEIPKTYRSFWATFKTLPEYMTHPNTNYLMLNIVLQFLNALNLSYSSSKIEEKCKIRILLNVLFNCRSTFRLYLKMLIFRDDFDKVLTGILSI